MHSLKTRKEILTNVQVGALLKVICETDFELLPYHVLCIFAGIRPKEVERLTWSNINMDERYIEVPDEKSKTAIRCIVEMEPLLVRWLDYHIKAGGNIQDGVTPTSNLQKTAAHSDKSGRACSGPFAMRVCSVQAVRSLSVGPLQALRFAFADVLPSLEGPSPTCRVRSGGRVAPASRGCAGIALGLLASRETLGSSLSSIPRTPD
jgi:hypothetical protein